MARTCPIRWVKKLGGRGYKPKLVSADKRFAITPIGRDVSPTANFHVVDLDTYNEHETKTLRAAKAWACARKGR